MNDNKKYHHIWQTENMSEFDKSQFVNICYYRYSSNKVLPLEEQMQDIDSAIENDRDHPLATALFRSPAARTRLNELVEKILPRLSKKTVFNMESLLYEVEVSIKQLLDSVFACVVECPDKHEHSNVALDTMEAFIEMHRGLNRKEAMDELTMLIERAVIQERYQCVFLYRYLLHELSQTSDEEYDELLKMYE